jgi:hypothetical protein
MEQNVGMREREDHRMFLLFTRDCICEREKRKEQVQDVVDDAARLLSGLSVCVGVVHTSVDIDTDK